MKDEVSKSKTLQESWSKIRVIIFHAGKLYHYRGIEIRYLEKKEMEKEDRKRDFKNDWRATLFWKK